MPNQHYTEFPERSSVKGGGSPPSTGLGVGPDGTVNERLRSYPAPGRGQPKDRSNGVQRAPIYPQSKGL